MDAWINASHATAANSHEPQLGVVGRAGTADLFELRRWAPSDGAARWVEHFWSVSWDLRGHPPVTSSIITFPALHLTREWGTDSARHGYALPATLVHGVVPRVFTITLSGRGAVVGARFWPGGFAARFNRDVSPLTGRTVPGEEFLCRTLRLGDHADDVPSGLEEVIGAHHGGLDVTYVALTALLERVRADAGVHRVEQVMGYSPWSTRTTQRVFRRYVGVPVKWVLCRYRLQRAALQIETEPTVDFADLAVRLGWFDQAHFVNDFRTMLGCTPGRYARDASDRRS